MSPYPVRLPAPLRAKAQKAADARGIGLAAYIRLAIEFQLERDKEQDRKDDAQ